MNMLRGNRKGFYEDACNLSDEDINKSLELNNEIIAIDNVNKHVYCTQCVNGKSLIKAINKDKNIPEICNYCHPYNPEGSMSFSIRRCYIEEGV